MKKNVFAIMASIFFMGSTMSMAPVNVEEVAVTSCHQKYRNLVMEFANNRGEDANDDPEYLETYLLLVELNCNDGAD